MSEKKLQHIKSAGFKTPKNYFDGLEDNLLENLTPNPLKNIQDSGLKMPEGYLDDFEDNLLKKVQESNSKVISLNKTNKLYYLIGIAASLVLMISIFINRESEIAFDDLETASMEDYLMTEGNASDLASLFNEYENLNDILDSNYYTDNDLESYMIDNLTIEDLIEN